MFISRSIEQAKLNTEKWREWLLIHKKNHTDPIVIMSWNSFKKLVKRGELKL